MPSDLIDRPAVKRWFEDTGSTTPRGRRHRRRHRWLRISVAILLAIGALVFPMVSVTTLHDFAPWVGFKVLGTWEYGPPGTAFLSTVAKYDLRPKNGSLLGVGGQVLKRGVYPGAILLNGQVPEMDRPLAEGDRITIRNGKNRVEPIVREVIHIPAGKVTNPQFYLGSLPGDQIIEKGEFSGQIVSSVFRPTGPGIRPNTVALTFDDGPWPNQTTQFLAVLKRLKVRATFFLVGYLAERYPDLVRAEMRAGMEIGDHSWDHPTSPSFGTLPPAKINEEIGRTQKVLAGYGIHTPIFRPPGGSYSDAVIKSADGFGMRVVIWSIDPKDWKPGQTTAAIVKTILAQVGPGSIILLHDGGGDRSATLAALPKIIRGIRKMGLGFSTLDS